MSVRIAPRLLACLRGIQRELQQANKLKELELELSYPDWAKTRRTARTPQPKMVSVHVPTVAELNQEYEERQKRDIARLE